MKPIAVLGVVLIVVGVIALAYQGFTYTTREKVLDLGPIEATKEKKRTVPIPPVLGGLSVAAGVALLLVGARQKS